jgi:hypothetical protein
VHIGLRVHESVGCYRVIFVKFRLLFIFIDHKPSKFDVCMRYMKMNQLVILMFFMVALALASCGTSKNGNCGCPNRKGMVGY